MGVLIKRVMHSIGLLNAREWRNTLFGTKTWDNDVKWDMPGWKNEMRFSDKTLNGDWYERRIKHVPGSLDFTTTNSVHFCGSPAIDCYENSKHGVLACHQNVVGHGKELLYHHGKIYTGLINVSNYDEDYNKNRAVDGLRKWDRHKCKWTPERIDVPVMACAETRQYITLPPIQSFAGFNNQLRVKGDRKIHGICHTFDQLGDQWLSACY